MPVTGPGYIRTFTCKIQKPTSLEQKPTSPSVHSACSWLVILPSIKKKDNLVGVLWVGKPPTEVSMTSIVVRRKGRRGGKRAEGTS